MTDSVFISLITAFSGIVITFITVRFKNQPSKPKAKDRIDTAFDVYEGLIKQMNAELGRKEEVITRQALEIKRLEKENR